MVTGSETQKKDANTMQRIYTPNAVRLTSPLADEMYNKLVEKQVNVSEKYFRLDTRSFVHALKLNLPQLNFDNALFAKLGRNSTTHMLRVPTHETVTIGDTKVIPELILRNSFEGECAFQANIGFFRLVCSNGMMVGESLIQPVKLRHIQGRKFEDSLEDFTINLLKLLDSSIKNTVENKLMGKVLSQKQTLQLIEALPETVVTDKAKNNAKNEVKNLTWIRQEDRTGDGFNAWNIWNIVNEQSRLATQNPNSAALVARESKLMDTVQELVLKAA